MNKHVEKEYKMLVNKEQFDKLCSLYENLNFITQTNTYYDTVNGDIQKKKGAMRIRERNGRFLFTLKMRQENLDGLCECECEVSENSIHALQSEEIVQLLHEYEIEYEYKQPHDGLSVFQKLLSHVQLVYEKNCTSKIQRALQAVEE